MTLVDSNVLLDVFSAGQPWVAWSKQQLERALRRGPVFINDVIYAEISPQFAAFEALDAALKDILIDVVPMPRPALFLAGRAFRQYRTAGVCEPVSYLTSLLVLMPRFSICRS
jgi:predicted nucleic acid-binding protein